VCVDACCGDELLVEVVGGRGFGREPVAAPVGNVGEETDVLAGEVFECGEFEEWDGVCAKGVFEGGHGQHVGFVGLE
jgi:hypothetical protein